MRQEIDHAGQARIWRRARRGDWGRLFAGGAQASAVTVEVAKKCDVLTEKAYPLRVPGNPAAGHLHGSAKEIQDYFNKCVANDGNVAEPAQDNKKTSPNAGSDKGGQAPGGTK